MALNYINKNHYGLNGGAIVQSTFYQQIRTKEMAKENDRTLVLDRALVDQFAEETAISCIAKVKTNSLRPIYLREGT